MRLQSKEGEWIKIKSQTMKKKFPARLQIHSYVHQLPLLLIIVILIIILINKVPCSAAAPTMQCQTCFKSLWVQKFLCKLTAFNMFLLWPQQSFMIANSFAGRCTAFKSTLHSRKLLFSLIKLKRQMPDGSITYWHQLTLQENQFTASGGNDLSILWETFGVGAVGVQQLKVDYCLSMKSVFDFL